MHVCQRSKPREPPHHVPHRFFLGLFWYTWWKGSAWNTPKWFHKNMFFDIFWKFVISIQIWKNLCLYKMPTFYRQKQPFQHFLTLFKDAFRTLHTKPQRKTSVRVPRLGLDFWKGNHREWNLQAKILPGDWYLGPLFPPRALDQLTESQSTFFSKTFTFAKNVEYFKARNRNDLGVSSRLL